MKKEFKKLLKEVEKQGATIKPTKSGCLVLSPDGKGKVALHGTPSDHRALQNAVSQLRKAGFDV